MWNIIMGLSLIFNVVLVFKITREQFESRMAREFVRLFITALAENKIDTLIKEIKETIKKRKENGNPSFG